MERENYFTKNDIVAELNTNNIYLFLERKKKQNWHFAAVKKHKTIINGNIFVQYQFFFHFAFIFHSNLVVQL